ncbi:MAG: ArsR/SmtB family transcription factor [Planktomarina sp.]
MESSQSIANLFSAFAHVSRVNILRVLLAHPNDGLMVGELRTKTDMAASTLAFHLREMEQAGVITRTQIGRQTIVALHLERIEAVMNTFTSLCCPGQNMQFSWGVSAAQSKEISRET